MTIFINLYRLTRLPIALFTAYSGLTACLLGPERSLSGSALLFFSISSLAAGASALNQCQEREIDSRMERTRRRPLPAGAVAPAHALMVACLLIAGGLAPLALFGTVPVLLALLALVWYNGVYTCLKRVTAFAAVPGAVVGMISPAIGWSSAGGSISDPRLIALCFLFFLWQVPHFWLQVLHHGAEYEHARLPCLSELLTGQQISRLIFIWTCAAACAGLLLPLYGTLTTPVLSFLLLPGCLLVVLRGFTLLRARTPGRTVSAFRMMNGYMLFVLLLLSFEGVMVP